MESSTLCSICIATYKRPELLQKLLKSLYSQELPEDVFLQIIVVDNDAKFSSKNVLMEFNDNQKISIIKKIQPIQNIALTRNLAVKLSSGDYILMIDDDEYADSNWVKTMLNTIRNYKADGVFGFVMPNFSDKAPNYIKFREFYFNKMSETGTYAKYTFTNNCILRTNLLKSLETPFNPDYGITGGSDTELFNSLISSGAKFINCKECVTYEFIPPERSTIKYIIKRNIKGGNTYTRRNIESSIKPTLKRIEMFFLGTFQCVRYLFFSIVFIFKPSKSIGSIVKFAANIGRIIAVFNKQPNHYLNKK